MSRSTDVPLILASKGGTQLVQTATFQIYHVFLLGLTLLNMKTRPTMRAVQFE